MTFRDSGECARCAWGAILAHEGDVRESIFTLKQADMLGIMLGERKERQRPSEHLIQMPPKPIS